MFSTRQWWKRSETTPAQRRTGLLAIVIATALSLVLLSQLSAWGLADARTFDYLSTLSPPPRPQPGPVIVAIDEPSFQEIGRQWPWPRSLHARLIEALRAAGARVIGLDVILADPTTVAEDAALAAAMGGDVVLAADESVIETPQAAQLIRTEPLPSLLANGARPGITSIVLDRDGVLRRAPGYRDGFAVRLAETANFGTAAPDPDRLLQAFGPARSYQTVSYYQALDPTNFLPPDIFKNRIVLVGLSLQSAPTVDKSGPDAIATSYTVHTGRLLPGVEIQATILDNLMHRLSIAPPGIAATVLSITAGAALGAAIVWRRSSWRSLGTLVLGLVVISAGAYAAVRVGRIFVPPLAPAMALLGVVALQGLQDFAEERRLRAGIVRAFSQYLAPPLVERLAANPSQLSLGGETRRLTILFCDVRGFTRISESMKSEPQRLTALVNRLLTPLSEAVMSHQGTIDKYIGDSVMAFWNAPLDDADHAVHAVQAASGMLAAVERLNRELAAEQSDGQPLPILRVGIGINTGESVVGNMGSDRRFDYSALGDAVNLASRLESASKEVGVPILIGEDTATEIAGRLPLLPLARIRVKGRETPVVVWSVIPTDFAVGSEAHRAFLIAPLPDRAGIARRLAAMQGPLAEYYRKVADAELELP